MAGRSMPAGIMAKKGVFVYRSDKGHGGKSGEVDGIMDLFR